MHELAQLAVACSACSSASSTSAGAVVAFRAPAGQLQRDHRVDQPLLRAVVQIADHAPALVVGGGDHPCARRGELGPRPDVRDRGRDQLGERADPCSVPAGSASARARRRSSRPTAAPRRRSGRPPRSGAQLARPTPRSRPRPSCSRPSGRPARSGDQRADVAFQRRRAPPEPASCPTSPPRWRCRPPRSGPAARRRPSSSRPTSSATAAKTSDGEASCATSVATRRRAACSSASRATSARASAFAIAVATSSVNSASRASVSGRRGCASAWSGRSHRAPHPSLDDDRATDRGAHSELLADEHRDRPVACCPVVFPGGPARRPDRRRQPVALRAATHPGPPGARPRPTTSPRRSGASLDRIIPRGRRPAASRPPW